MTEQHKNSCYKCIKYIMAKMLQSGQISLGAALTACEQARPQDQVVLLMDVVWGQLLHQSCDCGHTTRILGLHTLGVKPGYFM